MVDGIMRHRFRKADRMPEHVDFVEAAPEVPVDETKPGGHGKQKMTR